MAPNQKYRQNNPSAADDALLWVDRAKYQPLTHPNVEGKSMVIEHDDPAKLLKDTLPQKDLGKHDEYWQWSTLAKDTVISKTRSNEAVQETGSKDIKTTINTDLFSSAFIESRLLAESQRLQERLQMGITIIRAPPMSTDKMAYWDERSDKVTCEANRAMSDRTGYWDWLPEDQVPLIRLLLKEEMARRQVCAETMERRLLKESQIAPSSEGQRPAKIRRASRNVEEDEAYWVWDSSPPITVYADPNTVDDSYWEWNTGVGIKGLSAATLAAIVNYEATRELFSIQHVTKNIVDGASEVKVGSKRMAVSSEESDDYWVWAGN
jgi:hypothetical protein